MVHSIGIIPARAKSSRFPDKILAPILGRPMIEYVWRAAQEAERLDRVLVATDDERIAEVVTSFGGDAILTSSKFRSGSDRVASVVEKIDCECVVGLQGDEPLIHPKDIDNLVAKISDGAEMATLAIEGEGPEALDDPNVVKVLADQSGRAIYFSRQPLRSDADGSFFQHIGIYAYKKDVLLRWAKLPPSPLEKAENLEQLRALENGIGIQIVETRNRAIGVDVPGDRERVESYLRKHPEGVPWFEFGRTDGGGVEG